jgi:outer membrane protein
VTRYIVEPVRITLWVLLSAICAIQSVSAADGLTLEEYFAAAMERSEVVATQSELIRQTEERYNQANAALRPTVSGVATYKRQDPVPAGASSTANNPNRDSQVRLNATQPLFRGFREFAALRQSKALLDAQNEDYLQARIQLFKDVTQNFYTTLSIEKDLINLEAEIKLNRERETEINSRVRIGRSRPSEVLTVQSTIGTLRAQMEQLRGQLGVEREVFAFLSGLNSNTALSDTEIIPINLAPQIAYLSRVPLRPDVKASQRRVTAAQENMSVAKGAKLPTVDLTANRYLDRSGNLRDSTWDVAVELNVPLYTGGLLQSQLREAISQQTQAELAVSQVTRQAEQEIRAFYQSVVYDSAQLDALEKATVAARKNYEAQQRDYRFGLVTNLEVLQALTSFQENQRALDRARYTAKLNFLKLEAAVVRRPDFIAGTTP